VSMEPTSFDWPEGVTPARAAAYGFQADQFQRFQPANPSPVGVMIETGRPMLDSADCVSSSCKYGVSAVLECMPVKDGAVVAIGVVVAGLRI
jgi:hypothetical protein